MPPANQHDPTPAEWKVLSLIWEQGPFSGREVLEALQNETDWSPSTVKTLLRRLVDKGLLRTRKVGNSFLYTAKGSPMRLLRKAGDTLLGRTSEATVGPLLSHLVKSGGLSQDDLNELRTLVDRLSEDQE